MNDTELLSEIRDLLLIMAEPQIAVRDKKPRDELVAIVGRGKKLQQAVLAMDGSRSRPQIISQVGIDHGQLSRLLKALGEKGLMDAKSSQPKLGIPIPKDLFEKGGEK